METRRHVESGEWRRCAAMEDYRGEWLTDVFVERATWRSDVPLQTVSAELSHPVVVRPGYVWARFWFRREGQVVEKYFSAKGRPLGYFVPVCMPFEQHGNQLSADILGLALWVAIDGRVTVLGEAEFDAAIGTGRMAPVIQEHAEMRIRELTTLVAQRQFPPAMVRNFTIVGGESVTGESR